MFLLVRFNPFYSQILMSLQNLNAAPQFCGLLLSEPTGNGTGAVGSFSTSKTEPWSAASCGIFRRGRREALRWTSSPSYLIWTSLFARQCNSTQAKTVVICVLMDLLEHREPKDSRQPPG